MALQVVSSDSDDEAVSDAAAQFQPAPPQCDADLDELLEEAAYARARVDRHRATAQLRRERIAEWLSNAIRADSELITRVTAIAEQYALQRRKDTKGREKRVSLPYGLITTSDRDSWKYDEKPLSEWAHANDFIRHTPAVDLERIRRESRVVGEHVVIEQTGEIVPGIVVKPGPQATLTLTKRLP